jgi:hypothetical protein
MRRIVTVCVLAAGLAACAVSYYPAGNAPRAPAPPPALVR